MIFEGSLWSYPTSQSEMTSDVLNHKLSIWKTKKISKSPSRKTESLWYWKVSVHTPVGQGHIGSKKTRITFHGPLPILYTTV